MWPINRSLGSRVAVSMWLVCIMFGNEMMVLLLQVAFQGRKVTEDVSLGSSQVQGL